MTFLPIVDRELRVASRRRGTYIGRLAGALLALIFGMWILAITGRSMASFELGKTLFVMLSMLLFFYALGGGVRMTSDCLSEEKREGTLGLLFLTDLKGYDIVFGKLVANSLTTFYSLLAAFPVLAISLLMGGVTSKELWRVSLVSINLLFLSLAVGMFASAFCRDERKAISLATLLGIVILGLTPLIELLLNINDQSRQASKAWLVFSPAFSCFHAFDFGGLIPVQSSDFWIPVIMTQVYSWILLGLAIYIVPRSWQDKAVSQPFFLRRTVRKWLGEKGDVTNVRRTRLLEINPYLWLSSRDPFKTKMVWIALFFVSCFWLWGYLTWPHDWTEPPVYVMNALTFHLLLKCWLASEATHRFVQDRKTGALELMLSTPMSVEEILRGQRLALLRQFAGPTAYVLFADTILCLMGMKRHLSYDDNGTFWIALWVSGVGILLFDLYALSWVGLWTGLSAKKVNRASGSALARIMVVPWVAYFLAMTVFALASLFSSGNDTEYSLLFFWVLICVINNAIFFNHAKTNLRARFRELASQRFTPSKSLFGWLKGSTISQPPPLR